MSAWRNYIKQHAVAAYYILAFVISWGGVLLVIGGPGNIPATPDEAAKQLPWGVSAMLLGPAAAGLAMTGLAGGRAGYRVLWARLCRWRVGAGWYALALLTAPLLMLASLAALSTLSPQYLPGIFAAENKAPLLIPGVVYGLAAGLFEELGWTGFALPRLRRRHGLLATGLGMGFLWGAWHYLVNFWGSGDANGDLSMALLLPSLLWSITILPAYRVLMVWVWDHTGSLPVAMLMHTGLTSGMLLLNPLDTNVHLSYDLILAALLVLAATLAVVKGGQLPRPTLRRNLA